MNSPLTTESIGFFVGLIIGQLIFVIPLILNFIALTKPMANKKCVIAIIIVLLGCTGSSLSTAIFPRLGPNPVLLMIPGLLLLVSTAASTVLAIIGLIEVRGQTHFRGRKRAITALVINVLMVLCFIGGMVTAIYKRNERLRPLANVVPGQPIVREDWNFRITPPPGWKTLEGSKINPLARAVFVQMRPEIYSMVLAENPPGSSYDNDTLLELVKTSLQAKGEVKFLAEGKETSHGLEGLHLESEINTGQLHLAFHHWITQSGGYIYQVVTWGSASDANLVRAANQNFRETFEILDSNHVADVNPALTSSAFHSATFGYSVDPAGTAWKRRWDTLMKDSKFAEYGVQTNSQQGCFYIIPVWTGEPAPNLDATTAALAMRVGIDTNNLTPGSITPWTQGPLEGQAFSYERTLGSANLEYHVRVLQGRGYAYVLAAWRDKNLEKRPQILDEILDRVTFDPQAPAAPEIAKLDQRQRQTHMLTWNDIGIFHEAAGQQATALPWFQRAFEVDKRDATPLGNYMDCSLKLGKAAESLVYLDQYIGQFPGHQKLALKRANAQFAAGDEDGALKDYAKIFDGGYHDDKLFADYVYALAERGQTEPALAAIDRYADGKPTPALRRIQANVWQNDGKFDKAVEILTDLQKAAPSDTETTMALADCFFAAERYTSALAECEKLISARHDTARVWQRKGLAEYQLKRFREAKTSLEKAHEKDPPDTQIKRMLDHVSGLLGEGGNSLVKKPIEAVPVPAALLADAPADKAAAYLRGFSAYYVHAVRAFSFEKSTEFKTTDRQAIRVLDAQGVEKFSTIETSFDPLSEEVFVNSLLVKNTAGEVVGTGRVEDSYVVDDGQGETATQRKVLHLPVPGLQPGFTVEYTITRRETGVTGSFPFRVYPFVRGLPALRSALHVVAPRESVKWEATPGLPAPKKAEGSLTWIVEQPPVYRWEPLQAPMEFFLPMVWLGDAKANWAGEGKDYLDQIKDRLVIDPAVRTAATEAIKGLTKEPEKVAALARLVQRDLTYKAIEFGRRARMPATAAQSLRNKYGDCKDHALLLTQLLESAGIKAHLALVSFQEGLRPGLPSLDQFDHMIVYVPAAKGGTFIDCTNKSGDLRSGPPFGLATHQALVLDPERPRLETIPDYRAGDASVVATRDISFANESDLEIRESVVFTGYSASAVRSTVQAIEAVNRNRWLLQTITQELTTADLREAKFENVDDPLAPLRLQLRYVVPRRFQAAGGQLIGQLPCVWERWYLTGIPVEQRQTPFKLALPMSVESHVTLAPPAGWQVLAGKGSKLDRSFYSATASSQVEAHKLKIDTKVIQRPGQFSPGEYRAYLDATAGALEMVEQGVVLKRDGK